MKKQLHILEGIMILILILIAILLTIKFIYHINHEPMDTTYMWNITFTNLQVKEESQKGDINLEDNLLTVDVTLKEEGQFYEFTIDTENKGTLDAKIEDIVLEVNNPQNILAYTLTYEDNSPIQKDDILPSNTTKTLKIRISYPKQKDKIYDALNLKLSLNIKYTALYK